MVSLKAGQLPVRRKRGGAAAGSFRCREVPVAAYMHAIPAIESVLIGFRLSKNIQTPSTHSLSPPPSRAQATCPGAFAGARRAVKEITSLIGNVAMSIPEFSDRVTNKNWKILSPTESPVQTANTSNRRFRKGEREILCTCETV